MTPPTRPGTQPGAQYDPASSAPTVPLKPVEKASLLEDFIEIFYAPSHVFARRANTSFVMPLLVIAVLAALFTFANRSVTSAIFDAEFARQAAKTIAANPQITPEMMNSQRGIGEAIANIAYYVGMPLLIFIVGFFTWLAAKMVSAKLTFETAVVIAAFAQVPRLVQAVLTTIQALVLDTNTITSQHSFGFSPARFMDADATQKPILDLVGRFDLFTIWATLLIGIGIAAAGKVPRSKGYIGGAIVWGIASLLTFVPMLWS